MSNPFDLLGNDVEDADVVVSPPREVVKKNTSSKKADVLPPSADPARANKNRPKPSGNEGAIRDKSAGRQQNRSRGSPDASAPRKSNSRRATDRQNRSGKVDTQRRVNRGWGDDKKELNEESAAKADAEAELAEDAADVEDASSNKMSLQQYMEEMSANGLNKTPEVKKSVNALNNAELLVKEEEVLVEATKVKNVKSKQMKTKEFLDFDASFVDPNARPRNNRNAPRRGGRAPREGRKPSANPVQRNKAIDTKNLPSLA